jgi:hypothetical protein
MRCGDGLYQAHYLLNRAQQEARYELEADIDRAWRAHVCEGLEGGFIVFDQQLTDVINDDR